MRVLSAAMGLIGASLGGALPAVFVLASLILMAPPPGGGGGPDAFLFLVLATQGGATACYLAALAGAGLALWGSRRVGAALMAGGAVGAVSSGVAYMVLLDDVMHPAPPVYPERPDYVVVYLLPAMLLCVAAVVALAGRPSEGVPSPTLGE